MCFFEAANPDVVRELNQTAKIPFKRIVEAMNLTPKLTCRHADLELAPYRFPPQVEFVDELRRFLDSQMSASKTGDGLLVEP